MKELMFCKAVGCMTATRLKTNLFTVIFKGFLVKVEKSNVVEIFFAEHVS